jgi:hypothetical protein
MRIGLATLLALALGTPEAHAARPKPPPCDAGRFLVEEAASPLVPGATTVPDEITLGADGSVTLASGCPAVAAKQKGAKKGNKLSAKWTKKKGLCSGLPKTASLKATFDPACTSLSGTFKSKGVKRAFAARRLPEGLGAPSLTPTLEAARAATRSVGPAGGEVRARGADGTKYVLLVPPGALSAEVSITMTPASAVGGLPLAGGLVGAVELEPEGLSFALPAELKVIPPGGLPDLAVGFSGTGPANAFGVHPGWEDAERRFASLALSHFSLYGLGIPGPTQLAAFAADLAVIQGWIDLAFTLAEECTGPCDWETIVADWYDLEVDPRLDAGAAGTVAEALSGSEALRIWRMIAALGSVESAPGVTSRLAAGLAQNHASLLAQKSAYTKPACSGAVSDWKDWLRIPDEIRLRAEAHYDGAQLAQLDPAGAHCISLELRDLTFPAEVAASTTALPLSFRTVIAAPGGDVGVTSEIVLGYESDNASGPTQLTSAADGSVALLVQRALGTPRFVELSIEAEENTTDRIELYELEYVSAGSLELAFEADFDPGPPAYLEPGSEHEVCVLTTVEPLGGQTVFFFLDGPGAISAPDAETVDEITRGRACIAYTAPEAPVAKDLEALLTATLVADGETYQDTLHLHPAWVDIRIHSDVGEGWVPATNQAVDAEGDGPFDLRGTFTMNPPLFGDPPPYPPFAGREVTAETDETTLRRLGTLDLFKSVVPETDELGRVHIEWDGVNANQSSSTITFLAADLDDVSGADPLSGASVTLDRGGLPDISVQFPSSVQPGVATPLVVTVYQNGEPAPGYYVEVEAVGGSVVPTSGNTDVDGQFQGSATLTPGQTLLTLTITLREEPGGEALAVQTAQAAEASEDPLVVLVDRRDQCGGCGPVLLGPRVGVVERDGTWAGGGQSSLEADVQTLDGTLAGSVTRIVASGSGSQDQPSPVNPFVSFRAELRVESPVLATFSFSATGDSAVATLARFDGGVVLLGCAPLGSPAGYCATGGVPSGTVELAPGLYSVSGVIFYQGTSFHLEVDFAPAP